MDVYVNGVPPNFDLSRTPSKELSDAAGPNLKSECEKKFPHGVSVGAIADTGGYNLPCQRVYHVTLPDNQKDGSQNQVWIIEWCIFPLKTIDLILVLFCSLNCSKLIFILNI